MAAVVATKSDRQAIEYLARLQNHKRAGTFGAMPQMKAIAAHGYSTFHYTHTFDGEKTFGEIGPIKSYLPDYYRLRARSWQSFLESEIAQIAINRYITWVIGEGLKLQSEPAKKVLETYGVTLDGNAFSELVEPLYAVYSDAREAHHGRMKTRHELSQEALKNALIGGDCLVILRLEDTTPTIQLVDGEHVQSPVGQPGNELYPVQLANGNRIENGIELSPANEHVAYYVRKPGLGFEFDRVPARGENNGLLMAFMVYGLRYRLDNHRGIPLLAVVLETIKKLERYKEATVGSAEERQKIAYAIEHKLGSTGENPLFKQAAIALGMDDKGSFPTDSLGEALANKVAATTGKQAWNLPIEASMKTLESKNELYFKDFYTVNIDIVCACLEIPPNVAMSKYDSNYSASRAAIKDWEHTLKVKRKAHANGFEKPVYSFWLHVQIFMMVIPAPGFLQAWMIGTWMIIESYIKARFVGPQVPHIDPLKEVEAVRKKLGATGDALPLTTLEAATEELGGGGSDENMEQYAEELEMSKDLKIEVPLPTPALPAGGKKPASDEDEE